METPQLNHPVSGGRDASDSFTTRQRAGGERDSTYNRPNPREPDENRSPATLPRAFEGMLKTTTETGDIGMFSIKPSRARQPLSTPRRIGGSYNNNGLQKSRQTFQPFGVPNVDDRRRLPSYARDATSEVISMYETASQKSASRVFDDPDYRSYSMTQTSYSAYTLSNHRSYTSLRSQQDSSGLLQRPRSPFAYPARLKRPGFRPSSPALTDGGLIDYSRRAEIDRTPYGGGHATSSPSSLYAQRRKPPLSLRQEANRSTPSLLSQPSPPRRSPSPGLRQSSGNPPNDWTRRNGTASGNTSPARSTFSLASTVNLYATVSGTSNTTTPGKLAPSSPLYYDYTEDFEGDGYHQSEETLGLPPQFSIEKKIPEERPMTAEYHPSVELPMHSLSDGFQLSSPTTAITTPSDVGRNNRTALPSEREFEAIQPSLGIRNPGNYSSVNHFDQPIDKKTIRLSGLGYGAQELSTRVEEAFGLLPTKSFEISVSRTDVEKATPESTSGRMILAREYGNTETQFMRSLSNIVDTDPPRLSSLPSVRNGTPTDAIANSKRDQSNADKSLCIQSTQDMINPSRTSTPPTDFPRSIEFGQGSATTAAASSSQCRYPSSSEFQSIDTGFIELTDLIKTLEDSNRVRDPEKERPLFTAPEKTSMLSSSIPDRSMLLNTNANYDLIPPVSSFNQSGAKDSRVGPQTQPSKWAQPYSESRKTEASILGTYERSIVPNFSHQMAVRAIPRSGSPMLAPKPISPARQLKLKNSVPQLMKALPPLPPEIIHAISSSSNRCKSPENGVPSRPSPPLLGLSVESVQKTPYQPAENALPPGRPVPAKVDMPKVVVELGSASTQARPIAQPADQSLPIIPQPPPKLKLKMRNSAPLQPLSPSNPRSCNTEESHPWSIPDQNAPIPSIVQAEKPLNSKPPKFRLKITRASGSTHGTVRVNRESGESKSAARFHLRNHKDLFTSTAGIDNVFRQVSQHLYSRKASAASNTGSESHPAAASLLSPNSYLTPFGTSSTMDLNRPRPQSTKPLFSTEVRSVFSDESSHIEGHNSMRGRLSNLRARIAVSHVDRTGSQSYDDLTWRNRSATGAGIPNYKRSTSNLHTSRESTESRPLRRFPGRMQHSRLKEKVQGWLKEARSAIVARMKSRSTTGSGQIEGG